VVQSTEKSGSIHLTASSEGLKDAFLQVISSR